MGDGDGRRGRQRPHGQIVRVDARRPHAPQARGGELGPAVVGHRPSHQGHVVTLLRWWHILRARLRSLTHRGRDAAQWAADLEFHLDAHADELIRAGVSPDEARRRARAAFGGQASVTESYRDLARVPVVETAWRDLRYAARGLRRSPGVAATAVCTLALCLGATLAVFAMVDAVLLRPLPFPAP